MSRGIPVSSPIHAINELFFTGIAQQWKLNEHEVQVLLLLFKGFPVKVISQRLKCHAPSIVQKIHKKIGVHNQIELVVKVMLRYASELLD